MAVTKWSLAIRKGQNSLVARLADRLLLRCHVDDGSNCNRENASNAMPNIWVVRLLVMINTVAIGLTLT